MTMTRMSKLIVAGFLIPPWVVFFVCVYWYFFDIDPPARFSAATTFTSKGVETDQFKRGDIMIVSRERCIDGDGVALFNRVLVGIDKKILYFMPGSQIVFRREGCSRAYQDVLIPSYVEPGRYEYIVTVHYQNNPLVEGVLTLPPPLIRVLEDNGK